MDDFCSISFVPDQKYAWGKPGDQSVVASLKAAGDKSYEVDADEPYAEMWIGTHPSGPSNLLTNSGNVGPLLKVIVPPATNPFHVSEKK